MTSTPQDRRRYEPSSAAELMQEWPGWVIDRGNTRWYARGPAILSGEDLADLRNELIAWTWRNEARKLATGVREQS
jgi:hypothetical protein